MGLIINLKDADLPTRNWLFIAATAVPDYNGPGPTL